MFDFSPIQIIIVLAIALLVLGPKRLPEMGRSLGRGFREFKGSITGQDADAAALPGDAGTTLARLEADEAVELHQAVPAPTPEIAAVEVAEAQDEARAADAAQRLT